MEIAIGILRKVNNEDIVNGTFIIPEDVTSIGNGAFYGCSGLKKVNIRGEKIGNPQTVSRIDIRNRENLTIISVFREENVENIIQCEDEKTKKQLERIFNKCKFNLSRNYNVLFGNDYLFKMIDVLGLDETEKLLGIPEEISKEKIQENGEKLLEVYEPIYDVIGELRVVLEFLDIIDKHISMEGIDRKKFYTELNKQLSQVDSKDIVSLLKNAASDIGIGLDEKQMKKIQDKIQTIQFEEKREGIKEKIKEELLTPELGITQIGVASGLIFNVIRKNILEDGTEENIEEKLKEELNRTRENDMFYYGANIREQEEKLFQVIKNIYQENRELLKTSIVEILQEAKEKTGQGWIRNLLNIKGELTSLEGLTEEEKRKLEESLTRIGIKIEVKTKKTYKLKEENEEEAYKKLDEAHISELLTYEKAEMMFSEMKEPYSIEFRKWFIKNKEEIMGKWEYYAKIAALHNMFEEILENPRTKTIYEQGKLSVEGAIKILEERKNKARKGNEELGKIADSLNVSQEELDEMQNIFEETKKREKSYIPQEQSTQKRYRGRVLRADDPMNILAGNATDCCQKIGGPGEGSMKHGAMATNGRIFIVEELDECGKVIRYVAQSWVWRNKDTICFDNIEIPESQKGKLKLENGDKEAQEEILKIYQECAETMIEKDEKMFLNLLKKGKITKEQYDELVLKYVTVGTGYNDLGVLDEKHLEVVPEEEMILPRKEDLDEYKPWVDSGKDSVRGKGAQLYLAKSGKKRVKGKHDLEDIPILYANEREVRDLKGKDIDEGVVRDIIEIENTVYREKQKVLQNCYNYEDIAEVYEIDSNNMEIKISREKDWYMICEEREDEAYIADIAMVNGVNAEKKEEQKTEIIYQTLEMSEEVYTYMLQMAEKEKNIRFEATEDTSYKNILNMVDKGLATIEEENTTEWEKNRYNEEEYDDNKYANSKKQEKLGENKEQITMHNMVIKINKEKLREEIKRIQVMIAKRKETRMFDKVDKER